MARTQGPAWDVVAVTTESAESAAAFQAELGRRRALGALEGVGEHTILMAVPDPHPQPSEPWYGGDQASGKAVVGSGGATLNAVLAVAEQLSARRGTGTLDASVFQTTRVLVLHSATNHRIPVAGSVGKAFSPLPGEIAAPPIGSISTSADTGAEAGLVCNVDLVLRTLGCWVGGGTSSPPPPGVWVCSTEFFLNLPAAQQPLEWVGDITAVALPSAPALGAQHGVYKLDSEGRVERILYRATEAELAAAGVVSPDTGTVPVVAPIVRFSADAAELLLGLYASAPLDGCTSYGYDAGGSPVPVNLYLDILGACCTDVTDAEYLQPPQFSARGRRWAGVFNRGMRELLWKTFNQTALHAVFPSVSAAAASPPPPPFAYVRDAGDYLQFLSSAFESGGGLGELVQPRRVAHAAIDLCSGSKIDPSAVVFNSSLQPRVPYTGVREGLPGSTPAADCALGGGAVVEHSLLHGVAVGAGSLVSGVNAKEGDLQAVPPHTVLQQCRLTGGDTVMITYGVADDLYCVPPVTYCGVPWEKCVADQQGGGSGAAAGLWAAGVTPEQRCLYNARLFCCRQSGVAISIAEVVQQSSAQAELDWRRELGVLVDLDVIKKSLSSTGVGDDKTPCLLPAAARLAKLPRARWGAILRELDAIITSFAAEPHLVSRALATMADLLAAFAGVEGGLRSGPARNEAWVGPLAMLTAADVPLAQAVAALAQVRDGWLGSPERLMRAARHYEAAAAKLISRCVETATAFIAFNSCEPAPVGQWVVTSAPARIDLAGGWTDTPPVSYEYGGVVVNCAILVDGKRALEARVRRIAEPVISLRYDGQDDCTECRLCADMADYSHPLAAAALLKTAILCIGLVDLDAAEELPEQLERTLGGGARGLEIVTASRLPMGSGLGGSSVLGGALLHALGLAVGREYDTSSLVHAVLKLEQMLSSGGGWQDQVGGLYPGFKMCRSAAQLPLRVVTEPLAIPAATVALINQHLVLCYSGQARLARNLLQGVLRRWFGRLPEVVGTVSSLVSNAEAIVPALQAADVTAFGACVSAYWRQKTLMAGCGVEPTLVTRAFAAMEPYLCGHTMAGAGGGGFILLVTKQPNDRASLQAALDSIPECHSFSLHTCEVDIDGMQTTRGS